jgi:hypothetical protein
MKGDGIPGLTLWRSESVSLYGISCLSMMMRRYEIWAIYRWRLYNQIFTSTELVLSVNVSTLSHSTDETNIRHVIGVHTSLGLN